MISAVTPMAPAPTDEIETSTPRNSAGGDRQGGGPANAQLREVGAKINEQRCAKDQRQSRDQQRSSERAGDQARGISAAQVEMREDKESKNRHRHAAACQTTDDSPIHGVRITVHEGAESLRHCGVEQVRARPLWCGRLGVLAGPGARIW
jgi:hypothetical protein